MQLTLWLQPGQCCCTGWEGDCTFTSFDQVFQVFLNSDELFINNVCIKSWIMLIGLTSLIGCIWNSNGLQLPQCQCIPPPTLRSLFASCEKVNKYTLWIDPADALCFKCHLRQTALAKGQFVTVLNTLVLQGKEREPVIIGKSKVHIWVKQTASHFKCHHWLAWSYVSVYLEQHVRSCSVMNHSICQLGDLSLKSLFPCWLRDARVQVNLCLLVTR